MAELTQQAIDAIRYAKTGEGTQPEYALWRALINNRYLKSDGTVSDLGESVLAEADAKAEGR